MLDHVESKQSRIALLREIMLTKGVHQYGLDSLSQLQHALQAAWQAEKAGLGDAMIAAALLHDIGHMVHDLGENPAADGIDDEHEEVGARFLDGWFDEAVAAPVRLHVAAKRYLCGSDPGYFALLSPDSVRSLALQGGPMDAAEQATFRALPFSAEAAQLRRFDEGAKDRDLVTPDIDHFLPSVQRCLR